MQPPEVPNPESSVPEIGGFWPETRITILGHIRSQDPSVRAGAAAKLCADYRGPVLKRILSQWPQLSPEDAEDRCQQFFTDEFVVRQDGGLFSRYDPSRGRLRAFLGAALQRFLISSHRNENRLKRGGGTSTVSLNETGEGAGALAGCLQAAVPAEYLEFDKDWAKHVLAESFRRLDRHYSRKPERAARYKALRPFLAGEADGQRLTDLAQELGLDANLLSQSLRRLRRDWRTALEAVVLPTLAAPEDLDDELRYLIEVVRR